MTDLWGLWQPNEKRWWGDGRVFATEHVGEARAQASYWWYCDEDDPWEVRRIGDDGLPKPDANPDYAIPGDLVCIGSDEDSDDWIPLEPPEYPDVGAYLATRKRGDKVGVYQW